MTIELNQMEAIADTQEDQFQEVLDEVKSELFPEEIEVDEDDELPLTRVQALRVLTTKVFDPITGNNLTVPQAIAQYRTAANSGEESFINFLELLKVIA